MSIASKFGKSIANMFANDKKLNAEKAQAAAADLESSQEMLRKDGLKVSKTARFGFPFKPTCMAYDSVQHLLAIGTKNGYIKLFGAESVEYTIFHASSSNSNQQVQQPASPGSSNTNNISLSGSPVLSSSHVSSAAAGANTLPAAVLFIQFIVNEGALVVYCDDGILSFWNLRQKQPGLLFSKKLVNEKATAMHLPFQSNWLYVGTEKGNTFILNVYNNFSQSGYDIKWNNVIELAQKTKPGKVVHLSDCPLDSSKILIGFESGLIVLWNIKIKRAELRFNGTAESMSSISWLYDGKQFISSHNNGSLIIWNCKSEAKAANILHPHMSENDLIPHYNMVRKVVWESNKTGDQYIIFSDGLPSADCAMKDAITIIKNNKLKTIIEMKEKIIDFLVLNSTPWVTGDNPPDPNGIVVLLENNLIVIDLKTENFPQFNHHHAINLHDEPISSFHYVIDPSRAYFQSLLASKEKHSLKISQKQQQANSNVAVGGATTSIPFFSQLPYPINGGIKCPKTNLFFYNELVVTGHDDGSVKIWDTSGMSLSLLHKFKTHKYFVDKRSNNGQNEIENPFKITALNMSNDYLAVAAVGGHVSLFKYYSKNFNPADEELADIPLLEVPLYYENNQDLKQNNDANTTTGSSQSGTSNSTSLSNDASNKKDLKCFLRTKIGFRRQTGYLPELVCLLMSPQQRIPIINCVLVYSKNNMLLFGTDESIVCADYANRSILMNISIADFYVGVQDPFQRSQKSPKKFNKLGVSTEVDEINSNDTQSHNPGHFLTKQFTIESTLFRQASLREASRSSSNSSIENLAAPEGISFISINENSMINTNTESPTQVYQIWLGTTYGSIVILNTITNTSNSTTTNNSTDKTSDTAATNQIKSTIINTNNITMFQTKGQIVDICFIQMNGDLYAPINSNNNYESKSNKNFTNSTNNSSSSNPSNPDLLEMDLDFISNAQVFSNSIADNFKSHTTNATNSSSVDINTGSSNSPISTPSSFVNPFANSIPEEFNKEQKIEIKEPKESKGLFKAKKSIIRSKENSATNEQHDRSIFAIVTSEHQIKVFAMPSQKCVHKYVFSDCHVAKASVVVINGLSYLSCCLTNGTFMTFNLPNLKPAASISFSPVPQSNSQIDRISRSFTFGAKGHSFYMCSPNEMQKLYLSNNAGSANLTEMIAELFDPKVVTPQQPKPNLFKSIFSVTPFDREELFGENSGKPSTTVIKSLDNEIVKSKNEFTELQKNVLERGEKLSSLQLKSEQMTIAASQYAKNAHDLANKYKKQSKWGL